jgi:BirA family biotin operon repressor/biotin-[acetyl-CoA-carboxylase] ligase
MSLPADSAFKENLHALLPEGLRIGHPFIHLAETTSTNAYLKELLTVAEQPVGTVAFTDHQVHGRGRMGRSWSDEPGANLLLSVVAPVPESAELLGLMSLATALAVRNIVALYATPAKVQVKWPNDVYVLVDGLLRKVSGILLEKTERGLIIGIGLNVNQTLFEGPLDRIATSMARVTGSLFPRVLVLRDLLKELDTCWSRAINDPASISNDIMHHLAGMGEKTSVQLYNQVTSGILLGLTPEGHLRIDTGQGILKIPTGEILFSMPDADALTDH